MYCFCKHEIVKYSLLKRENEFDFKHLKNQKIQYKLHNNILENLNTGRKMSTKKTHISRV